MKFVNNIFYSLLMFPILSFGQSNGFLIDNKLGIKLLNIDQQHLEIQKNQIFFYRFNKNKPIQFEFTNQFMGKNCLINKKIKCSANYNYKISELDLNHPKFEISFSLNGKNVDYFVNLVPKNFPIIDIKGKSKLNEDFIFSWIPKQINKAIEKDYSYLFIFDSSGNLKYYEYLPFTAVDFRPHQIAGKTFYSYLKSTGIYPLVTIEGTRFILDSNLNFIKEFKHILDFHDFHLLGLDWYIGLTYEVSQNEFGTKYIEQKIIERKNGKIIFEWSTSDFMKNNPFPNWKMKSNFKGEFLVHQYHLNHIQIIDHQLLISLGFDSIILLDKKTKRVVWLFGGGSDQFGITDDLFTSLHHTPYLDIKNSTLTVFDNGVSKRNTRIIKYTLDFTKKKLIQFKQIAIPHSFSAMMGSVVVIGENYTIGFGSRDYGDFDILEVENNKIIMSFKFKNVWSSTYKIYRMSVFNN